MDIETYNKSCYDDDGKRKPGKVPLLHNMGKVIMERSYIDIYFSNSRMEITPDMTFESIAKIRGATIITKTPMMYSTGTVYEGRECFIDPEDKLFDLEERYVELVYFSKNLENKRKEEYIKNVLQKIKNCFTDRNIPIPKYYAWR